MEEAEKLFTEACAAESNKNYELALSLFQQGLKCSIEYLNYGAEAEEQKEAARKLGWRMANRGEALKSFLKRGRKLPKSFATTKQPLTKDPSAAEAKASDKNLESIILESIYEPAADAPRLSDVIGLETVKSAMQDWAILPMAFPSHAGNSWAGILLFGPTGTGKTHVVRAVANECNSAMLCVSSSTLASKWHGEAEKMIKIAFDIARARKPSIIFMDEVEWLCSARSGEGNGSGVGPRMKSELLTQMTAPENNGILVLAATNVPQSLDPAFLRRFSCRVYVKLPNEEARYQLLKKYLSLKAHVMSDGLLREIAEKIKGYSGSDIKLAMEEAQRVPVRKMFKAEYWREVKDGFFTPCVSTDAGAVPMRYNVVPDSQLIAPPVMDTDVKMALGSITATVTPLDLARYEQFDHDYGYKLNNSKTL